MIDCQSLSKCFRHYHKQPGISGSIQAFFSRSYVPVSAVENFDLKIEQGEFIGLLGPNGAGKTTLMKMFTGIIVPSSGSIYVVGHEPWRREIAFRQKIALVMGQKSQLWWDIPALDSFMMLQRYYNVSTSDFKARLKNLGEILDVEALFKVHVRKLSLGERMKMELIASLLHRPEIIFLDEPTIGLDLSAQANIRSFLKEYQRQQGCSIILTSHYMADVTALCQRIVMIMGGQKRFDGTLKRFEGILGNDKMVSFRFEHDNCHQDSYWQSVDVHWLDENRVAEVKIPESKLRQLSAEILSRFPVIDFYSEKLPIERVMEELMRQPAIVGSETSYVRD